MRPPLVCFSYRYGQSLLGILVVMGQDIWIEAQKIMSAYLFPGISEINKNDLSMNDDVLKKTKKQKTNNAFQISKTRNPQNNRNSTTKNGSAECSCVANTNISFENAQAS